jgi:hypothetical protein
MPYDLSAIERGFGECDVEWPQNSGQTILIRYRADVNNRALIAMKRVMVGVLTLDGSMRFPDVEAIIDELIRVLLPAGPDVPEDERGWDLTNNGVSVPITFDTVVDLPPGLPAAILGGIFRDINDPNRRRPSKAGSSRKAASVPEPSPTTTGSSAEPNGQASLPGPSLVLSTPVNGPAGIFG